MGIPIRRAAMIAGVSHPLMMLYEADPEAVITPEKRNACRIFYEELRRLLTVMEPWRDRAKKTPSLKRFQKGKSV